MLLFVAMLISFTTGDPATDPRSPDAHALEIRGFANVVALSQVSIRYCESTAANMTMIRSVGAKLHYDPQQDAAILNEITENSRKVFEKDLARARSIDDWCALQFKLFGPSGTLIPDILWRRK